MHCSLFFFFTGRPVKKVKSENQNENIDIRLMLEYLNEDKLEERLPRKE